MATKAKDYYRGLKSNRLRERGLAMSVPSTRELPVHSRAVRRPISLVVAELQEALGQRLTAVIAGTTDGKAVWQWARGERAPHPRTEKRLRDAYQVVQLLLEQEGPETIRAWFIGMNPELDDEAPAIAIAEEPKLVLSAARAFLANG